MSLKPTQVAYLSACSTGFNQADDLLDESLHLMGTCHLVGFRHVVGTLWAGSDSHCVGVARKLQDAPSCDLANRDDGRQDPLDIATHAAFDALLAVVEGQVNANIMDLTTLHASVAAIQARVQALEGSGDGNPGGGPGQEALTLTQQLQKQLEWVIRELERVSSQVNEMAAGAQGGSGSA
ncbi:hypothetical protein ACJZ2D_011174 [Fusarium nematophilum]